MGTVILHLHIDDHETDWTKCIFVYTRQFHFSQVMQKKRYFYAKYARDNIFKVILYFFLFSSTALCNAEDETELNGTTSQSTDYIGPAGVPYVSTRAIDGNQTRCAHTRNEINSWWRIDLLGVYTISSIRIYNVEHHNSNITGSRIYIGNSREENGTTNRM